MRKLDDFELVLGGLLMGMLVGLFVGYVVNQSEWKADLIDRGVAIHCPTTGDFAFSGECK